MNLFSAILKQFNSVLAIFGLMLGRKPKTRLFENKLHGFNATLNPGNIYPEIALNNPLFNAALVETTQWLYANKGRKIVMVDVGAAYGDTVMLLEQRCPQMVARYICIDGSDEFYPLLVANTRQFLHVDAINALLASDVSEIPSLRKTHGGTAACIGDAAASATTLDTLMLGLQASVDLLKIDVDGFDGEVLAGAEKLILQDRPIIVFEWHPVLWDKVGNRTDRPFHVLERCGYATLMWFDNCGEFSHFSPVNDAENFHRMAEMLRVTNSLRDRHFDILAIPSDVGDGFESIGELKKAREAATCFPVI